MSTPIHERVAEAIERLSALARAEENQRASAEGLSPLQAHALRSVARRPGQRLGALAGELFVTYGTLSAAISTLEQKGLVKKSPDPEEHRAVNLSPTRAGRALARRVAGWSSNLFAGPVADLKSEGAGTLLEALLELIASFERSGSIARARMCLSCRHFKARAGAGEQPHFCGLLEQPIGRVDLRTDCLEHEPAPH